jgi:hypothetical protein
VVRLLSITQGFSFSRLSVEHELSRGVSLDALGQFLDSVLYIGHAWKPLTIPEHRGAPVAKDSMCSLTAAFALSFVCAIVAVAGCDSAPKGQSVAECERALDSAIARADTTAHFPSQVRADSTVKSGEIEGVVVSALTNEALSSVQLSMRGPDSSGHYSQLTDRDGRFHIVRRAPGRHVILARQLGYKTDSVQIDFLAGATVKIALRVNPLRLNPSCCPPLPKGSICI